MIEQLSVEFANAADFPQRICLKFGANSRGLQGGARFFDGQVNKCAERPNPDTDPPYMGVGSIDVVERATQPNTKERAKLV